LVYFPPDDNAIKSGDEKSMLKKIESFIIATSQYEAVSEFFADILRLEASAFERNYAIFELDGFPIYIARSPANISYLSIETDDIESDFKALTERGAEFFEPIHFLENGDRAAFFRAPGGFEFMLLQPTRRISRI
jgi:predicted enzyme related to lactoylglutathione lyase